MNLVEECSNWLLSQRHAVITRFDQQGEVSINSWMGPVVDERRWVSYDPSSNHAGIVTVDTRVKAGIAGDMLIIEHTNDLPLGFCFTIRADGIIMPFELVQRRPDASLWRINDDGTVYSHPAYVYPGDTWQVVLVYNRRSEQTEWLGSRSTEY